MSTKSLRRDEASKFFVQYSQNFVTGKSIQNNSECDNFIDLDKAWYDLLDTIKLSCKL